MVDVFERSEQNRVAHEPECTYDASGMYCYTTFQSSRPEKVLELYQLLPRVPNTVPNLYSQHSPSYSHVIIKSPRLPAATFTGGLSAHSAGELFLQLLDTLESAHSLGIIHANISPRALYSCNGRVLLGDFRYFYDVYEETKVDYIYEEPEVCESDSEASDIYSLGKLFLYLATECEPKRLSSFYFLCPTFYIMVKSMTAKDKKMRPSIPEVRDMIKSGFTVNGKLAMYMENESPLSKWIDDIALPEMQKQITDDLQFHDDQKSSKTWIFKQMVQYMYNLQNAEDKPKLPQPTEEEAIQLQSFAQSSLETGTVYQRHEFYSLALYCYLRAAFALKLARKGMKGKWKATREVQKKLKTSIVNYISLKDRLSAL